MEAKFSQGIQIAKVRRILSSYKVVYSASLYKNGILYFIAYSSTDNEDMERYHHIVINEALTPLIYHDSNVTDALRKVDFKQVEEKYRNMLVKTLGKIAQP